MASKYKFRKDGASWWKGGHTTHRGVTRDHRYIVGGDGLEFQSDPYSEDWFVLGVTRDSSGQPYKYRIKGARALELTFFCQEQPEHVKWQSPT